MLKELSKEFNGKQIVAITDSKSIKDISHLDARYLRNLDPKLDTQHLGLLNLFEQARIIKVPFMREMMKNKDYIYVNGKEGSFKWDIPLDVEYPEIVENVEEGEFLGIDGLPFKLKTSHPYRPGDILTYDVYDGVQVYVMEDTEVVDTGTGFEHTVTVNSKDKEAYFPASKLVPGTRIFKVGSAMGEYSTSAWSGITGGGTPKVVTVEHRIGSPQGVEVSYTDWANSIDLTVGGEKNTHIADYLLNQNKAYGEMVGDANNAYLIYGTKQSNGKIKVQGVERLLHMLALAELYKMTHSRLMFAHGSTITGVNGSVRINEGIYPQLRRGHRFTFRNEIELEAMIRQAADVIFSNTPIPVEQRKIKFKGGLEVTTLIRQIFKDKFLNTFPVTLEQAALPVKLLSGSDRYNLTYESFAIGTAFLDGIGNVEIEHDPSLDYDYGDIVERGYHAGKSKRTWSLVIWDVTDRQYSNVYDKSKLPKGVDVDQRARGKNLFLVKPKNAPDVSWGVQTGRMSGQGVKASMQHMGEIFFASTQLDAVITDLSRVVLIEKETAGSEDAIRYFNN